MSKRKIRGISRRTVKNERKNKTLFYIAGSIALFAAAWTILPRLMQHCTRILYKAANRHSLECNKKTGLSKKKKYK